MEYKQLVFGDDGSPGADLAWLWINCHQWPRWQIEILTAVPPLDFRVRDSPPVPHLWAPPHPRRVFSDTGFEAFSALCVEEDPRLALALHADMLVIGARGESLLKALHIGSTAEWLVVHPPCPLILARHGRVTRNVVVCHDGSAHAGAAVDALCAAPWLEGTRVMLLTVEHGRHRIEVDGSSCLNRLEAQGAHVRCVSVAGDVTDEIAKYVQQNDADLVVLGTRGLTGLKRVGMGSTARALVHSIEQNILIASAPEQ